MTYLKIGIFLTIMKSLTKQIDSKVKELAFNQTAIIFCNGQYFKQNVESLSKQTSKDKCKLLYDSFFNEKADKILPDVINNYTYIIFLECKEKTEQELIKMMTDEKLNVFYIRFYDKEKITKQVDKEEKK